MLEVLLGLVPRAGTGTGRPGPAWSYQEDTETMDTAAFFLHVGRRSSCGW